MTHVNAKRRVLQDCGILPQSCTKLSPYSSTIMQALSDSIFIFSYCHKSETFYMFFITSCTGHTLFLTSLLYLVTLKRHEILIGLSYQSCTLYSYSCWHSHNDHFMFVARKLRKLLNTSISFYLFLQPSTLFYKVLYASAKSNFGFYGFRIQKYFSNGLRRIFRILWILRQVLRIFWLIWLRILLNPA